MKKIFSPPGGRDVMIVDWGEEKKREDEHRVQPRQRLR